MSCGVELSSSLVRQVRKYQWMRKNIEPDRDKAHGGMLRNLLRSLNKLSHEHARCYLFLKTANGVALCN